jgi:hypothetical protein
MPPGGQSPAPRKRRTGLIVGAVIAAGVLLAAGIAGLVLSARSAPSAAAGVTPKKAGSGRPSAAPTVIPGEVHSLVLPASADGFRRLTGTTASDLVAAMRTAMTSKLKGLPAVERAVAARSLQGLHIGLYFQGNPAHRLVFIGYGPHTYRYLQPAGVPGLVASSFLLGAGVRNAQRYPPGRFGGVLYCGVRTTGVPLTYCMWADQSTAGVLIKGNVTPDQLASIARVFRARTEH